MVYQNGIVWGILMAPPCFQAQKGRPVQEQRFSYTIVVCLFLGFITMMFSLLFLAASLFVGNLSAVSSLEAQDYPSAPSYSYLHTNMTPAKNQQMVQIGLSKVASGEKQVEGLTQGDASKLLSDWFGIVESVEETPVLPLVNGGEEKPILAPPIKPCQFDAAREWAAYCGIMWASGMQLDCDNANAIAKAEILQRLAESHGCVGR